MVVGSLNLLFPRRKHEPSMGAASSLCHCAGNLRSGECVLAKVTQLLTAQVCLTSQPETSPHALQPLLTAET